MSDRKDEGRENRSSTIDIKLTDDSYSLLLLYTLLLNQPLPPLSQNFLPSPSIFVPLLLQIQIPPLLIHLDLENPEPFLLPSLSWTEDTFDNGSDEGGGDEEHDSRCWKWG